MRFNDEKPWQQTVELAEHYLAIGQTEVWLGHDNEDMNRPWEYVTRFESGGSHRLDISTDIRLYAEHPSGLTFRWSVDVEKREANGQHYYAMDVEGIRRVVRLLSDPVRTDFRVYLLTLAETVEKRGREYQELADKQRSEALQLRAMAGVGDG